MKRLEGCLLYTFVDTTCLGDRDPALVAQELCDGGSDLIQVRAKDFSKAQVRAMAERVQTVTSRAGVGLVINDYPDVAYEIGAEICHMGQEDFFGAGHTDAAQVVPSGTAIKLGLSTHSPQEALTAIRARPDYIAIGPVYATGTKPSAKPVTLDYVRWAAKNVHLPWFAIGGINLNTLDEVLEAGARRICVVSAILNADNVAKACQAFRRRIEAAQTAA